MTQTTTQPENLLRYVEALESGQYRQDPAGGYMKTNRGYCCLGVLREVDGTGFVKDEEPGIFQDAATGGRALPPGSAVIEFLGLPNNGFSNPTSEDDAVGTIRVTTDEGDVHGVHALNDMGVSFQEIARLIRREYGLPPLVATF